MKKLYLIICFVMAISVFGGCRVKESPTTHDSNETKGEEVTTGDEITKGEEVTKGNEIEMLSKVLNNETTFVAENGKTVYLKQYQLLETSIIKMIPIEYAFVDMDQDGTDEMVLYVTPDFGAYLVFYIYEETIYCFQFNAWEMRDLKTDGTFVMSEDERDRSYLKITFEKDKYSFVEKAYENTYHNIYRVNQKDTTKEKVDAYANDFDHKAGASWTKM